MIMLTIVGLGMEHLRHRTMNADIELAGDPTALPLCRGGSPADRITDMASIEE
jgi:hypothetical protein